MFSLSALRRSSPTGATTVKVLRLFDRIEVFWFALGMLALAYATGVGVALPYLVGILIDSHSQEQLQKRALSITVFLASGAVATFFRSMLLMLAGNARLFHRASSTKPTPSLPINDNTAGERLSKRLRQQIFGYYMDCDAAYFDSHEVGDLISRIQTDVGEFKTGFVVHFPFLVKFIIQALFGIIILFYLNYRLCLLMLTPLPVGVAVLTLISKARGTPFNHSLPSPISSHTHTHTHTHTHCFVKRVQKSSTLLQQHLGHAGGVADESVSGAAAPTCHI